MYENVLFSFLLHLVFMLVESLYEVSVRFNHFIVASIFRISFSLVILEVLRELHHFAVLLNAGFVGSVFEVLAYDLPVDALPVVVVDFVSLRVFDEELELLPAPYFGVLFVGLLLRHRLWGVRGSDYLAKGAAGSKPRL